MYKRLFILFFCLNTVAWSQLANDCVDAIVVCGNTNITTNASGFGTQELDNTANSCAFQEINSIWLQLNISESGLLAFTITPEDSDLEVDYDFFVFGPSATCGNFDNPIRCSTTNPIAAELSDNTTGLSDTESDQNEGPGANGNSFVSSIPVLTGETYFLLVDRPIGNGGFSLEWTGTSKFFDAPSVNVPNDIDLCLASIGTTIDLTPTINSINTNPDVEVSLYTEFANAIDGTDKISNISAFAIEERSTTIYARIQSMNGCFEITEFDINAPNFINAEFEYKMCDLDDDDMEDFSFFDMRSDIQNNIVNPSDYFYSFHVNENDATNNTSPFPAFNRNFTSTTIYARVELGTDPSCFTVIPINLLVIPNLIPFTVQLVQCDVDETNSTDGITVINLEQVFINLPDATNYNFFFYETMLDSTNDIPITNPVSYVNTIPNQIVFYKAISTIEDCTFEGELEIVVVPTAVSINNNSPFISCDENPDETLLESTFDLENIAQSNYPGFEASFFTSLEDLTLELNALPAEYTTSSTTIFVRLENENECQDVQEIEFIVTPNPDFQIPESYTLCTDGDPLTITAPLGFDSYTWYLVEGNSEQIVSNTINVEITEIGDYILEIRTEYAANEFCSTRKTFEVIPSNRAVIEEVIVQDFSENNTIEIIATGDGSYEFSIDDISYQDSNFFENVESGVLTVFVRDKNGCGITKKVISVLGYPKFFTPNSDGINDFWQIIGLENTTAQNTSILIYDRYGKLISQINPLSNGWNGTYNNNPLPSSDYWFVVNLADNRQFKGHFTLKR